MRRILPLGDEGEAAEEPALTVNKAFADRLAHNKQREALHRLQELQKRGIVDSSDDDEEGKDDESSDDGLLADHTDARIFDTLSKIKHKDPSIYAADTRFFDEDDDDDGMEANTAVDQQQTLSFSNGVKSHKPVYLKDAIAKQLMEDGSDPDEDFKIGKKKGVLTYADEQEALKNEFLNSANLEDADEDDETGGFLKLRRRERSPVPVEEAEAAPYAKDIAQRLEEYFGKDESLDENDRFLKDYLLKKGWVDEDEDKIPSYEEIVGEVIEDEEELERQDRFEAEYNFRFEEGAGSQVMGHSRLVEDSVRRKDDTRRQKREKKKKRLSEAAFERREELKQLKNIKKKEILQKLKMIQAIAGAEDSDENLLEEEDLEEEFDPEAYDRKMREAFGEEYYGAEDVDAKFQGYDIDDPDKPNFEEEDELLGLQKGWNEEGDATDTVRGFQAARRKLNTYKLDGVNGDDEIIESQESLKVADIGENAYVEDYETSQIRENANGEELRGSSKRKRKAKISLREKLAFDKQLEEYYRLDYEDMIGDLPTRFKYQQVKRNMFGLTTADILTADDKDLNQFVSLKKIVPYMTQEWKPKWRFQSSQKMRKKKALGQQLPTQKLRPDTMSTFEAQSVVANQGVPGADDSKSKRRRRKKGLSLPESRLIAYGKISLPSKKRKRA